MVCDWGMSAKLGPRTFGSREEMMFLGREVGRSQDFSEATAQAIDAEVDALVRHAFQQARDILTAHSDRVKALVDLLLEHETVDGGDAEDLIRFGRIRTPEEREDEQTPKTAENGEPAQADPGTAATAASGPAVSPPVLPDAAPPDGAPDSPPST
jgi:cell division protease FtsH